MGPGDELRRQIEAGERSAEDPGGKARIPLVEPPLGVTIFEQLDLGASGPIERAHQTFNRRQQVLRQGNHPARPGLSIGGREALLHVDGGKHLARVGGEAYRLFGGTHVRLQKQPSRLPATLQRIAGGVECPPIGNEDRVMKRSLEPAPPRMAPTKLVELGIAALEGQCLGHGER